MEAVGESTRPVKAPNGYIVWRGKSLTTGDPIIVVVTGLSSEKHRRSRNTKTGEMAQAWVLREDISPIEAVHTGGDKAICGDCRHRSGSNIGRSCYVVWWLAPHNIWKNRAAYPQVAADSAEMRRALSDKYVRLTAYGDIAAAPAAVWLNLAAGAYGWTGYTHQWGHCDQALKTIAMASVDTPEEKAEAEALGWRTFRVRREHEPLEKNEITCPASAEAGHLTTCEQCGLCGGTAKTAKTIAILPHGQRVKWLTLVNG